MNDPITIGAAAAIAVTVISFLVKMMIDDFKKTMANLGRKLDDSMQKIDEKIKKLEDRHDTDIKEVQKELSTIKGDFSTAFVLREDYFRSMNSVEDKMKSIDNKLDKLLLKQAG